MPNYLLIYLFDNCYVIYLNKKIEDNLFAFYVK